MSLKKQDKKIINNLAEERNWNDATTTSYRTALNLYLKVIANDLTLSELLTEAEKEDETVRWKKSKLRKRLVKFRHYLYKKYNISTAKLYLTRVSTFYRTHDIILGDLPYISEKGVEKTPPTLFQDLPDKEVIRTACTITNQRMKAIILFMSSSGCARTETLNLTIRDFIEACSKYHNFLFEGYNDEFELIDSFIKHMFTQRNVIPSFRILRSKTDKHYYTFSSPESVESILSYLFTRNDTLSLDKKLFKVNSSYFFKDFAYINEKLQLGKVGGKNRFRSHMLRKFHASNLAKSVQDEQGNIIRGMTMDAVDSLQGRGKLSSRSSYFFDDFETLKLDYIQNLHKLTIFSEDPKFGLNRVENSNRLELPSTQNTMNNNEVPLVEDAPVFSEGSIRMMDKSQKIDKINGNRSIRVTSCNHMFTLNKDGL